MEWGTLWKSPSIVYNVFVEKFKSICDNAFPLNQLSKTKQRSKRHPLITKGILYSIKKKNKLFRTFLKTPSTENKSKYKTYRNKLNYVIRISKKNHYYHKFSESPDFPEMFVKFSMAYHKDPFSDRFYLLFMEMTSVMFPI